MNKLTKEMAELLIKAVDREVTGSIDYDTPNL